MKIIELRAENVKRLKAVHITPDGTLQVVGGRNAQGKTSVLDAIWLALGGGAAGKSTSKPIRDGEDNAYVTLDLGDIIVTRTWKGAGSSLKVTSREGATFSSPQSMLDDLVGRLTFDPLAFTRLGAKAQRDALLGLVDLDVDLDALDQERAQVFAERTTAGREGKALGTTTVDPTLPETETSLADAMSELRDAQAKGDEITQADRAVDASEAEVKRLRDALTTAESAHAAAIEARAALPDSAPDTDALTARLGTIEDENRRIRDNNTQRATAATQAKIRDHYQALTDKLDALDKTKRDALASASFPVDGLGFDDSGVTLHGIPLSQASSAEQIRVSLGMAMAANPKLRVIRILDGSLLDDDAMTAIREQVEAHDFQVWIERVGNADEGAVIIEDGAIA